MAGEYLSFSPVLKGMSDERLEEIKRASQLMPEEYRNMSAPEVYQLALKKKRMAGLLQKAMREAGFEDLSKVARFKKAPSEEGPR